MKLPALWPIEYVNVNDLTSPCIASPGANSKTRRRPPLKSVGDIEFACATEKGFDRAHNEDTFRVNEERRLWVLCDGIGALENGAGASATACDMIVSSVRRGIDLMEAVYRADDAVRTHARELGLDGNMGTTVAAARLSGLIWDIVWVGDTRIYWWLSRVVQLSKDDSYIQELLDANLIQPEDVRHHPARHVLTRSLGTVLPAEFQVGFTQVVAVPGMQLLLCSDGLHAEVGHSVIETALSSTDKAPQDVVNELLLHALRAGGREDATAMLIRQF